MDRSDNMIASRSNRTIVDARKLKNKKYRYRQNRFLAEGLQALFMALDAGAVAGHVFYCEPLSPSATKLLDRFEDSGTQRILVSADVLQSLSMRDDPSGIIATFQIFSHSLDDISTNKRNLILVLDRLQDPRNLGCSRRGRYRSIGTGSRSVRPDRSTYKYGLNIQSTVYSNR